MRFATAGLLLAVLLAGATRHAAAALGLDDRGILEEGKRADLVLWDVEHPSQLAWQIAGLKPRAIVFEGVPATK